jgi:predicted small metal-binding protein
MASFRCKDIGMKCEFEIKDENRDELMWVAAMHADETHNLKLARLEMMDKIKKAVKK